MNPYKSSSRITSSRKPVLRDVLEACIEMFIYVLAHLTGGALLLLLLAHAATFRSPESEGLAELVSFAAAWVVIPMVTVVGISICVWIGRDMYKHRNGV